MEGVSPLGGLVQIYTDLYKRSALLQISRDHWRPMETKGDRLRPLETKGDQGRPAETTDYILITGY